MQLETDRLVLREMADDDFDAFDRIWGDPEVMKHYPYTFDEARVRAWIKRNQARYRTLGFGLWAVCLKETGEVIGDCGLTMQMINGVIRPEIGYHMRRDCQRKGYTKEAACAVRDWTFRNLPFGEIYSYMAKANEPSSAAARSYGCHWVEDYLDEDNIMTSVYVLPREEWLSRFA